MKPFDTGPEWAMSHLANGRVNLTFNNSVLMQKSFFSLYCNFILNVYMAYELNTWAHNPANNFTLKNSNYKETQ